MMLSLYILAVCYTVVQGILIPPQITYFTTYDLDKEDDIKAGDMKTFQIICNASGSLPKTFKWLVNGRPVDRALLGKVLFNILPSFDATNSHTSTLVIKQPSPDADGKYQCVVKNAAGGTFTRKFRVKVTYANGFVKDQNAPAEVVDVIEGRPTRLACPPRVKKFKDYGVYYNWGRKAPLNTMYFRVDGVPNRALLSNGDLLFLYLTKEDLSEIETKYKGLQCNAVASTNHWSHQLKLNKKSEDNSEFPAKFDNSDDYPKTTETAVQGKPKKLWCVAIGNPVPEITWVRLNDDKTTVMKTIKHGEDGFEFIGKYRRTLLIPLVFKEQHEHGYYQCVAKNKLKEVKSPATKLVVYVAPKWTSRPDKTVAIPVQSNKDLLCEAVGTPPPSYNWYHNGTKFTSDTELAPNIVLEGHVLKFKKIERYNEGVFQCAVENDWGMLVSGTWVTVKAIAPDITKFGPFYIFKETTATLECVSGAAPAATHVWKKDDKVITIAGRYSLGKGGALVIKDVISDDEGKYACEATNYLGSDSASADATVYERTKIIKPQVALTEISITLKKPLDLHCEATADVRLKPFLKYEWQKDGAKMKYYNRVFWDENDKLLEIKQANVNDGAKYTCVAYIDAKQKSQDTIAYIANVKGVPFPPSDLKITACKNMSTTITWKKGKDGNDPTTHFIVQQESTYEPDKWENIANITDPTVTSHYLKLTAYANLAFRMRAVNKIGPSRASATTPKGDCITPKYSPTMYPENLRGIPGKAEKLDIAWKAMTKLQANGPNLRYILYYRKADAKKKWINYIIKDQTVETFTIPDAGYYIKWEFKIVAVNDIARGPVSDVKWSFSGQNAPKGKPQNVKIGEITARSIELTWDRVDVEGRGSIDGYRIYFWGESKSVNVRTRREIPAAAKEFIAAQTTDDTQKAVVKGLKPYHDYKLALKAFNSGGEGPSSDEITFETKEDVPGKVESFEAYAFSSYIFASWGQPKEKNGVLLGYTIAAVKHNDQDPVQPAPTDSSDVIDILTNRFEYLFTKMDPESRYVVYLRAKTVIGAGPVSIFDLNTIAPAKPSKPRKPKVQANSTTAVNVTFLFGTSPGGYPTKFKVKYRETEPKNLTFKETGWFNHLDKRWTIVGDLAKDSLHEFVTVGSNKLGDSPDSPPTFARPMPAVGSGKRVSTPFYKTPWFIILLVLIVLLLLVLLIAILVTRRRGAKYPVGKREKARVGILENEPDEEDNVDMGRMDPPPYPSDGSLDKPNLSDDDRDSLDDYEEGPQFKEDGSFIEEYGDDRKKLSDDKDKPGSATFV